MKALVALFGKSPFKPLQAHMEKVRGCVEGLGRLFDANLSGDEKAQKKLVDGICRLESEADAIKDDVRLHLPKSILLPVDRRDLLEILALQDCMADTCQDIAITVTLRNTPFHPELRGPLTDLLKEVTRTCVRAADVIRELDELLETGFGGKEAEKVLEMIGRINVDETIADGAGITLVRKLFALEDALSPVDVMLWYQIFRRLGELANLAEGVGNRVRLLLAH